MSSPDTQIDVTSDAERRLRQALARPELVGSVFDGLDAVVLVLDAGGRIFRFNRFFEKLSGYDLGEVAGRNWFELFVPETEAPRVGEVWTRTLAGQDTRGTMNDVRVRDGTCRRIVWSNRVLEDGGEIIGVLAMGHDVTDLVRADEARRESEARMRAVVETAAEGIVTIDEAGTILSFNRAAEDMFGRQALEVIGDNVRVLMPEPYRSEHDGYLSHYLETGQKRVIGIGREVAGLRVDGSTFPMHLAVSEIGNLEPRMFTGVVRDLTVRKELERHLDEAAAEERHRVARDLHDDLGGTMTGISIFASILQRKLEAAGSPEAEGAAELARHVRDAHEQVRRVAHGLLPVAADPAGLVTALRKIAQRTQEMEGLRCSLDCEAPLEVRDHVAASHLYRLVAEAVENAVRHAQASWVRIVVTVEDDHAVFSVEDDGSGLPATTASVSGMGLRTMKYRAGLLDAVFTARARPEGGTVVSCVVPLERIAAVVATSDEV